MMTWLRMYMMSWLCLTLSGLIVYGRCCGTKDFSGCTEVREFDWLVFCVCVEQTFVQGRGWTWFWSCPRKRSNSLQTIHFVTRYLGANLWRCCKKWQPGQQPDSSKLLWQRPWRCSRYTDRTQEESVSRVDDDFGFECLNWCITNPAAQHSLTNGHSTMAVQSPSTISVAKNLVRTKGIFGLYRGLSATLLR